MNLKVFRNAEVWQEERPRSGLVLPFYGIPGFLLVLVLVWGSTREQYRKLRFQEEDELRKLQFQKEVKKPFQIGSDFYLAAANNFAPGPIIYKAVFQ